MTEGNPSVIVTLSKTQVAIARGMGMTLPQLASKFGLSNSQMRMALIDMGFMKSEESETPTTELTAKEQKFLDVCTEFGIAPDTCNSLLEALGLEYKTGRKGTKGGRKYIINDDLTA